MLLIEIKPNSCDFCGCCVGVCPEDAIELQEAHIEIIEERCTNCAKCVWSCPFEVLVFHKPTRSHYLQDASVPSPFQGLPLPTSHYKTKKGESDTRTHPPTPSL